jgi:preprotein translocase SecE subunit
VAKSRAQRKAEQRRRAAQQRAGNAPASDAQAQHDTQVPESADVVEAELAERGADLDELKGPAPSRGESAPSRADVSPPPAEPAPAEDKITRRERKRQEREARDRARQSQERRKPREEPVERERGRVVGFLLSCWAELKRVQWPTRDTLIQASAVTLIFISVAAAYLGVLDAAFNWLVQRVL